MASAWWKCKCGHTQRARGLYNVGEVERRCGGCGKTSILRVRIYPRSAWDAGITNVTPK